MTSISFAMKAPLGMRSEAACAIDIHGSVATASFADVMVDTGADYVMVPQIIALHAGISLVGAKPVNVRGIGASIRMRLVSGVAVEVAGKRGFIDVLFNPDARSMPLVGRNGIELMKEIAFDAMDWHWN